MAYYSYEKNTKTNAGYSRVLILGLFLVAVLVFSIGIYLSQETPPIIAHSPASSDVQAVSRKQQQLASHASLQEKQSIQSKDAQESVVVPAQVKVQEKQRIHADSDGLNSEQLKEIPSVQKEVRIVQLNPKPTAHQTSLICSAADKQSGLCE